MHEPFFFVARLYIGLVIHLDWLVKGVASAALLHFDLLVFTFQSFVL